MSHYVKIQTQVKSLSALQSACRELGVTWEPVPLEQQRRQQYGDTIVAHIRVGAYQTVSVSQAKGSNVYALGGDTDYLNSPNSDIGKRLGVGCKRLVQLYGVHAATAAARLKGYTVQRQAGKAGAINLVISGGAM